MHAHTGDPPALDHAGGQMPGSRRMFFSLLALVVTRCPAAPRRRAQPVSTAVYAVRVLKALVAGPGATLASHERTAEGHRADVDASGKRRRDAT
ncbi:hypothetical protein GY45DRAFT_694320 [Cubamyces sp. BRFM 1775]|nr:hypothetical protein GY45DRAFT_694320 [Cubamyces sp. BRFM 1775]